MLDIQEIRRHLTFMTLTTVADATGIDRNTLMRIKNGLARNPSHATVQTLSNFILSLRGADDT